MFDLSSNSFISDSQTVFHVAEKVSCIYYYPGLSEQFQRILLHETLDTAATASVCCSPVADPPLKAALL